MMARKLLVLLVAALFSLTVAGVGVSAAMSHETKGTVSKIEGGKVTIKDAKGAEQTVEPKNPEALKDLKVGDKVVVMDGKLTKEGGGGSPAPPPGKKY